MAASEFKRLWTMGFSCSNTSISITLKTFLKHTRQRQIASLLLLCKQGNVFDLFFQEQLKKKKTIKINLICFLAVIHTLIKAKIHCEIFLSDYFMKHSLMCIDEDTLWNISFRVFHETQFNVYFIAFNLISWNSYKICKKSPYELW